MPSPPRRERYDIFSRVLHWGMALLLLWQLLSASAHYLLEDTAIEAFFWPTHKPLGFVLFGLIVVRIVWAVINAARRPPSISLAATLGHVALYGLLAAVPGVALLRQYGSGRAFEPFGWPLMPGFEGDKISWMVTLGELLHSSLGWTLFALICGHIFMVYWHRRSATQPDVLPRMWG
jgi:cytochrome b561